MSSVRTTKKLFWASFSSLLITSSTFLWMPFIQGHRFWLVVTGIVFWATLIVGYILLYLANRKRKYDNSKFAQRDEHKIKAMGALNFFSNYPAIIADFLLLSCIVIALIISVTNLKETYIPYFILFLFLFSLNSHCLFNGKIYKFISNI